VRRPSTVLQRILSQHRVVQHHQLRTLVLALAPEPKAQDKQRAPAGDERRPVHDRNIERRRVGEAEDDEESNDVQAADRVDNVARRAAHPEPAPRHVGAAAEQMRQDGAEVRQSRQDDEGADEGVEGDGGADVDAAHDGADDAAEDCCVEGVVEDGMDLREEVGKGGGVVARERPEGSAGGEVAADAGEERGQEGDDEEANGSSVASGCLAIDVG